MSYKSIDDLMRHLCESGINIAGDVQKQQLLNTGYYHGYKGYRFFKKAQNRLPFSSYEEVYATIQYDSDLKSLFYGKVMFIETAVKNIALERILIHAGSEKISDMFEKTVSGYNNAPPTFTTEQRQKLEKDKSELREYIESLSDNEKGPKAAHFCSNGQADVPIWVIFEAMTIGNFAHLLACLTYDVRDDISRQIGFNLSCDTKRQLIYEYLYLLKDLRNAIAHNGVVFDTRFKSFHPGKAMKQCLKLEIGVPYVNFETIGDFILLICYFLKLLHEEKAELTAFVQQFERVTENYKNSVSPQVSSIVIHPDLKMRIGALKKYF